MGLDRSHALAAVRRSVEKALGPAIREIPPMIFLHALRDRPRRRPGVRSRMR